MSQISCRNLSVSYGSKQVLNNISLEINKGDYVSIIGENGTGKTTFIMTLLGLIHPTNGEIKLGDGLKQNEIGYLPQRTVVQKDFPASVYEVVLSGCTAHNKLFHFRCKDDKLLADDSLKRMNAFDLRNRCFRELSGGQQQRVLIARALCATQEVLLLDEPTAGLDPSISKELYHLISHLNKSHGITVIMITHDIENVIMDSSKILKLDSNSFEFMSAEEYIEGRKG